MGTRHKILIGKDRENPDYQFETEEILEITGVRGVDVVGSRLSVDELAPVVHYPYTKDSGEVIGGADFDGIVTSDGYLVCTNKRFDDMRELPFGTPVWHLENERIKQKLYSRDVDYDGIGTVYQINSQSGIGLLGSMKHYGGIYRGERFENVLADIIGNRFPYQVDPECAIIQVFGYLPYDFSRYNLHRLLFGYGVMVGRTDEGEVIFRIISNAAPKYIQVGRIYRGGGINYNDPATAVDVTEHSYMALATDEIVTEYDNTDGSETADHTFLAFRNAPLHDLEVTGSLVIEEYGVNYAIISGTGTLVGKKYTHSTRIMHRVAENTEGMTENVKTVSDCTLVTVANSENVAKRVLAYYSAKKTIKTSFVVSNENPGDFVVGTDPRGESFSGFLVSMEEVVSANTKATAEFITNYIPTGGGNNYTQYRLFTGEGDIDWISLLEGKDDDDVVQLQLGGGGHEGYSGEDGEDGTSGGEGSYGTGGEGGEGGKGGEGCKVLTITVTVRELRALGTSHYSCGEGGESDQEGGETTILGRSSKEGAVTPYGVANIFTGEVLGLSGESGIAGAAGSGPKQDGPSMTYRGVTSRPGAMGKTVEGYISGRAYGGWGGGAAAGANGSAGGDGRTAYNGGHGMNTAGRGGRGATPVAPPNSTGLGQGGNGGHGGGGGGGGGTATGPSGYYWPYGDGGHGGAGGKGGKGGPGFLQIYF